MEHPTGCDLGTPTQVLPVAVLLKTRIIPITANPPKGGDAKPWV